MRTASIPSGSSPIVSSRFAISFRLMPASMSSRTCSVFTKVALPRLPLPSTDTVIAITGTMQGHLDNTGENVSYNRRINHQFAILLLSVGVLAIGCATQPPNANKRADDVLRAQL